MLTGCAIDQKAGHKSRARLWKICSGKEVNFARVLEELTECWSAVRGTGEVRSSCRESASLSNMRIKQFKKKNEKIGESLSVSLDILEL